MDDSDDRRRRVVRKWSNEEDEKMIALVNKFGTRRWSVVGDHLPGRNGKQCRERCVLGSCSPPPVGVLVFFLVGGGWGRLI